MSSESGYTEYIKPDESKDKERENNNQKSGDGAGDQFFSGSEFFRISRAHEYLEPAEKNKQERNPAADPDTDPKYFTDKLRRVGWYTPECGPSTRSVVHAIIAFQLFIFVADKITHLGRGCLVLAGFIETILFC